MFFKCALNLSGRIFLTSFFLGLLACGSITTEDQAFYQATDFYPLDSSILIYRVDSVIFDLEGSQRVQYRTQSYLKMERILEQNKWWIHQFWRPADSVEWKALDRVSIIEEQGDIWESYQGALLKKIDQPLFDGHEWEETEGVNSSFTVRIAGEEVQPFAVPWNPTARIHTTDFEINNLSFNTYLEKDMQPEDLLIQYRASKEIYALDIGLVYRELYIADTQCEHKGGLLENCVSDPWEDKANRGYRLKMELIEIQ